MFGMFVQATLPTLRDINSSQEKMKKCSEMWQQLTSIEKRLWKDKMVVARQNYAIDLQAYKQVRVNRDTLSGLDLLTWKLAARKVKIVTCCEFD